MIVQDPNKQLNQYICISQNSIEFTSTVHRKEGYPTTPRKNDANTNDKESGGSLYQMLEGSQQISAMGSPKTKLMSLPVPQLNVKSLTHIKNLKYVLTQ